MRGNFSSYICLCLKKRSIYQLDLNADSRRMIFWFKVVNFVFMSIKFASVKKPYISPYPKIAIFRNNA